VYEYVKKAKYTGGTDDIANSQTGGAPNFKYLS